MTYKPKPPVPPRAVDDAGVAIIDHLIKIGMRHNAIAAHMGVHWRTVSYVHNRRGAYKGIPKPIEQPPTESKP